MGVFDQPAVLGDALRLARYDRPSFPCLANKRPACPSGFKDATADPEQLCRLWQAYPGPLVGVPTGETSGLFVVDVDSGRHDEANDWLESSCSYLPPTRWHATKSGGWHLLFKHRAGLRNTAGKLARGVDTRGDGGYIIWWPFHLGLGAPHLLGPDIAELPDWLFQDLTYRPEPKPLPLSALTMRGTSKSVHGLIKTVAGEKAGARNSVAFWAGNRLRESAHRMTRQQFEQARQDLIRAAMSTGLSFQEAKKVVENGLKNDRY